MKDTAELKKVLREVPDADKAGRESRFTGPPPEVARRIARAILSGGGASIADLVDEVAAATAGDARSYKPEYVLHLVALEAGRPGREAQRRMFCETLASKLKSGAATPEPVRVRLIRELQAAGREEVCPTLGELLPIPELSAPAAQALIAIGGSARGVLREALPRVEGAELATVVHALGVLRDHDAAPLVAKLVADPDAGVRAAATAALAATGGSSHAKTLLEAAERASGWERIQATRACLVLAERLAAMEQKDAARAIYTHLRKTRRDAGERYVREAAASALREL